MEAEERDLDGVLFVVGLTAAFLAVVLFVLHLSLGHQLGLMHAPWPTKSSEGVVTGPLGGCAHSTVTASVNDLRTDRAACAVRVWQHGDRVLRPFDPATALLMARTLVGVQLGFFLSAGTALLVLVRRARWRLFLLPLTVAWMALGAARTLADLAVMQGARSDHFPTVFDWTSGLGIAVFVALALGALVTNLQPLDRGIMAYLRAPATARLTAVLALGFALTFHAGKIGAQSEDILRRSLNLGNGAHTAGGVEVTGLARAVAALFIYLLVVIAARRISEAETTAPAGAAPPAPAAGFGLPSLMAEWGWRNLALAGVLIAVVAAMAGLALLHHDGPLLAPLLIGAIIGAVALASHLLGDPGGAVDQGLQTRHLPWGTTGIGFGTLVAALGIGLLTFDTGLPGFVGPTLLVAGLAAVLIVGGHNVWAWQRAGGRWLAQAGENDGALLYGLAALLPPLAVATLIARVLGSQIAAGEGWIGLTVLALVFIGAALVAGKAAADESPKPATKSGALMTVMLLVALGASIIGFGNVLDDGLAGRAGEKLGSLAVLIAAIAAIATVAAVAGLVRQLPLTEHRAFRALYLQRTPIVALLAAWLLAQGLVGAKVQPDLAVHRVRIEAHPTEDFRNDPSCRSERGQQKHLDDLFGSAMTVHDDPVARALCEWLDRRAKVTTGSPEGAVPLVLLSGSGGGVRAAAWTMRVLDCAFLPRAPLLRSGANDAARQVDDPCDRQAAGQDSWPYLFAAGGASGGSVGIVSTVAERLQPINPADGRTEWLRRLAKPDHVAPLLASFVYGDGLPTTVGLAPGEDRAALLADSWAKPFSDSSTADDSAACRSLARQDLLEIGFLEARQSCPSEVPLMLLNGTIVADGSRFDISPLRLRLGPDELPAKLREPESLDLQDVLCRDEDLPLIDAGFLSGRFPLVTPSGHIPAGDDDVSCGRIRSTAVQVVDGGYAEDDGTAQILELWGRLGPLLARYDDRITSGELTGYRSTCAVFVQIENGEHGGAPMPFTAPRHPICSGSARTALPTRLPAPTVSKDKQIGEPLRIPATFTEVNSRGGRATTASTDALRQQLSEDGVPIVRFALYEHPGRVLPLGWSLTEGILDDIDLVFAMGPNQQAARCLRSLLAGPGPENPTTCRRMR